jgi:tripartite-type tricarboxylate transporter receptor subunit TctC
MTVRAPRTGVCCPWSGLFRASRSDAFAEGTRPSRRVALLLLAAAWSIRTPLAQADEAWPVSITRFVVPFAAGGALDVLARIIAERLTREMHATFLVDSRPGAGGTIGTHDVVRAPADGSVLLFTSSSVSILPAMIPNLGFDPGAPTVADQLGLRCTSCTVGTGGSRFSSLRELIAEGRSAPGRLNYGSGDVGSSNHLAAAYFASMAGIDMVHIPYGGTAQTLNALYGGQIDLIFAPTFDVLSHVREGRLRALGAAMLQRVPALPDVPAIAEFVSGYAAPNWFAIFAPADLAESLRMRLQQVLASLRDAPDLRARFDAGAALPRLDGPEPLAARMAEEVPRWTQLVAQLGINRQ